METILVVDLEQFTKEGKVPPHRQRYRVKVGEKEVILNKHIVTGREILEAAGYKHPECHWLYLKLKGCDFEKIDLDEKVDLAKGGVEHFVVKPTEVFHYFVDGEPETTDQKEMTPNEILGNAGITPVTDYYLVKVNADGSQESYKDTAERPIKMVCPAVKFVSAFRGETPVS